VFVTELLDGNQDFNMEEAKLVFSISNMDTLSGIKDFVNSYTILETPQELDYPFEFLDPLLCTLIKNPVILPGTLTIMERNVIEKQLLEKSENPFDRSELTMEMLNTYNKTEHAQITIQDHLSRLDRWVCENTRLAKDPEIDNVALSDDDNYLDAENESGESGESGDVDEVGCGEDIKDDDDDK